MIDALIQLALFTTKGIIIVLLILVLLAGVVGILMRGKGKMPGRISIKNLNKKLHEIKLELLEQIYSKKQFKQYLKEQKITEKNKKTKEEDKSNVFVLNFLGDIKATAVTALREEITAVLAIAKPKDEILVKVESGGGMVHAYGLAAAQLSRVKEKGITLTVTIDKIAASGGYLMACVANKILAAPFAIIGSIGVIFQMPNFHKLLKEHNIDFEQVTAGNFKRTLTVFGKNTEEGRDKLKEELEEIHHLFKHVIHENRPELDINKVATGEHWLAAQAINLKLVDVLQTSDDYLVKKSESCNVYEVNYFMKKSFLEKLSSTTSKLKQTFINRFI